MISYIKTINKYTMTGLKVVTNRGATIHLPHDTLYDTYNDTDNMVRYVS